MKYFWFFFISLLIILYFYRCPYQNIIKNNYDIIYSPAYGRIMEVKRKNNKLFIAIFLSPFDVHYQFAPVSGKIKNIIYDNNGHYELAYDLNKSKNNEKVIYTIDNPNGDIIVYQIAGYMVRRITPMVQIHDNIDTGNILGLIHFGSRVDLIIPVQNFNLLVKKGDYLRGSHSIIGTFNAN